MHVPLLDELALMDLLVLTFYFFSNERNLDRQLTPAVSVNELWITDLLQSVYHQASNVFDLMAATHDL